jgi:hypothetical protein
MKEYLTLAGVVALIKKKILPLFGLDILFLSDLLTEIDISKLDEMGKSLKDSNNSILIMDNIELSQCINDSVTRYYYGAVPLNETIVNKVRVAHTSTALMSLEAAKSLDKDWTPEIVLAGMYCYSAWEPIFKYYRQNKDRFRSISISQFNFNAVQIDSFSLYESTERFQKYLESRESYVLSAQESTLLQDFMAERFKGNAKIFKSLQFFNDSTDDKLSQRVVIDQSKRNIFLFSNIYWDVGLADCSGLYKDVITWVLDTIELISNESSIHLYIKTHPGEVFDTSSSLKGVSQFIKEKHPILPENVTIIEPEWKINTYELFRFIDVGVIFNGTLGLEMMFAGIPVISTGKTTHQGLGFSMEPTSIEDYREALVGATSPPDINRQKLELFAYFYFVRTMIPWTLTKQAYADNFDGFLNNSLEDLKPGNDPFLDHLCNCILDPANTIIEAWPDLIEKHRVAK